MARLTLSLTFDDLADCDLVIEAVYESMDVKKDVFGRLDAIVKPGAILASNTSYLDVNAIAAATKRPEAVLGMHFFSPANIMKLLEVVRGAKTGASQLATVMALAGTIRKVPVVSGVCHGFIGNRMLAKRQEQANALIMEGAAYYDIDQVLLDFGFPMGPFQMGDLAGLDIGWHRDPSKVTTVREALCAAGRWGQKTGKGFYDYDDARQRSPSPEVQAIIADFAVKSGTPQRTVSREEIFERLLYPMVNEGALILSEGIAQRASDIDLVWLNGYGWPAWTGGIMYWADHEGLAKIVAGLNRHGLPVAPLLDRLANGNGRFNPA
jgi:3-hydroxyacyl-CoA dehydrogenase